MTDDLVKRLRDVVGVIIGAQSQNLEEDYTVARKAAERIEKLEAALAHIYAWYPISVAGPLQTVHEIRDFARKALEGNDD